MTNLCSSSREFPHLSRKQDGLSASYDDIQCLSPLRPGCILACTAHREVTFHKKTLIDLRYTLCTGVLISPQPDQEGNKLQRPNSNSKPHKKKKKWEGCSSNQVSAAEMTSALGRKMATFNCFFSRVGLRTYQHPCTQAYSCKSDSACSVKMTDTMRDLVAS